MHGERRGINVIQRNTNYTKTREKPACAYKPSGLAFSTDVHHRINRKDRNQTTMNNMGMERGRVREEPDIQSSGKATAKIETAAAASTFRRGNEDPYDSDSDPAYHFISGYFVQDRLEASIMRLEARLAVVRARSLCHGVL